MNNLITIQDVGRLKCYLYEEEADTEIALLIIQLHVVIQGDIYSHIK